MMVPSWGSWATLLASGVSEGKGRRFICIINHAIERRAPNEAHERILLAFRASDWYLHSMAHHRHRSSDFIFQLFLVDILCVTLNSKAALLALIWRVCELLSDVSIECMQVNLRIWCCCHCGIVSAKKKCLPKCTEKCSWSMSSVPSPQSRPRSCLLFIYLPVTSHLRTCRWI